MSRAACASTSRRGPRHCPGDRIGGQGRPDEGRPGRLRRDRAHRKVAPRSAGRAQARGVREARAEDSRCARRHACCAAQARGAAVRDAAAGHHRRARLASSHVHRVGQRPVPAVLVAAVGIAFSGILFRPRMCPPPPAPSTGAGWAPAALRSRPNRRSPLRQARTPSRAARLAGRSAFFAADLCCGTTRSSSSAPGSQPCSATPRSSSSDCWRGHSSARAATLLARGDPGRRDRRRPDLGRARTGRIRIESSSRCGLRRADRHRLRRVSARAPPREQRSQATRRAALHRNSLLGDLLRRDRSRDRRPRPDALPVGDRAGSIRSPSPLRSSGGC